MEPSADLNKFYVDKLLPNIVWMCVCVVVGLVGNSLVLFVYGTRMRSQINDRYFIRILAFLDLMSSVLSSLHSLINYIFYAIFPSVALCKFLYFGSFFTSALSAQTLLLIAIQRYRKVCVPFGKQMTLFWKRLAIVISTISAFAYSVPIIFTADIVHRRDQNVTAFICTNGYDNMLFNQIYFIGISVLIVTNVITVTVLYSRIAFSIYRRGGKQKQNENRDKGSCRRNTWRIKSRVVSGTNYNYRCSNIPTKDNYADLSPDVLGPTFVKNRQSLFPDTGPTKGNAPLDSELIEAEDSSKISQFTGTVCDKAHPKLIDRKNGKLKRAKVNFNKMFGAIVVLYLLSYIPTFVVLGGAPFGVFKGIDVNIFMFVTRLYIINHIVNPFVYGYFDFGFRHALKSSLGCGK